MVFSQEKVIPNTKGIKIEFEGRTYTTVDNIHGEYSYWFGEEYACFGGVFCLKAQCTTEDAAIMWGENGEESDWFPPEAMWAVNSEDLDAWIAKGDWMDCLTGVLVCDEQPAR